MSATVSVDVHLESSEREAAMAADVLTGLTASQKALPPVWFYDERGSQLFDEITRLPEYYLTRAEHAILTAHADEVAQRCAVDVLVEIGSGTSEKTRLLLDALTRAGRLQGFVPFDVSEEILREAAAAVASEYRVDVHAVVGDFHRHLEDIPTHGRRLVVFLGSTIGNLRPHERRRFFANLRAATSDGEWFLLGADLLKDRERLHAAYNDSQGVTAEFNRNVLNVVNRELDANFQPDKFAHVADWNERDHWMEMRLRSLEPQHVMIRAIDLEVKFEEGEDLLTEISAKFTPEQVRSELADGGFEVEATWTDPAGDFLLTLARPSH